MAITAVTPASGSLIAWGDTVSFTVDNTYTSMIIKVQTATALVKAYDTALGGAQAGYTVVVVDNGSTHTFTVSRDAGWDNSPQLIYVIEDETGSSATTNLSYTLEAEAPYPNNTEPYNSSSENDLVLSFNGRTGTVSPTLSDYDASQVDNDSGVTGSTVKDALNQLDADVTAIIQTHAGLPDLTNDDHTQYWLADGTRVGDALYFTERADHVNTPAAGKGELWVKNTVPCALYFTDDAGTDWNVMTLGSGDVTGPASAVDGNFAVFNGTTGKIIKQATFVKWISPELLLDITDAAIIMGEAAAQPASGGATYGSFWIKDTNPTTPVNTDGDWVDSDMTIHELNIEATVNTNGTINQWYSWSSAGPRHDSIWDTASGGTGATPSMTTSWEYPPLAILPAGARIKDCVAWVFNPDSGVVTHTVSVYVMGQALVDQASSAGTSYTHCFLAAAGWSVITPRWRKHTLTVSDSTVNADEGLYVFVRETGGAASRVDCRMNLNLRYTINPA